ncbi:MAG: transcriptional regulator swi6 [Pycnora praestabilis]|nr:MAG: transcriptional regulator swi6 [Pycnora praestabilis]
MASALHAAPPLPPPYPPVSFSRNSTGSSFNGLQLSFDGAPTSVASTPIASSPVPRGSLGSQQQMSFGMGNQGSLNGMGMQQGGYRSFGEVNGHVQQQQQPGHRPQIYTAVYSGVSVYEMEVNNVAVMRRRSDSWLNATQILKVAGIDKGKRTKVLEKEILIGEHEKVQGGYGKYQGTWIKYDRGVEFCRSYGVEELLRPLLDYDMGQDGMSAAGQGGVETPTKEQAMAAQRKRAYNAGIDSRPNSQSANGTFFKNISATASNAVAAISKARFDSPGPKSGTANRRPTTIRRPSQQQQMGSQESSFPGGSQQSMQSLASESSFGANSQLDSAYGTQNGPYYSHMTDRSRNGEMQEPPRKRMRPSSSQDPFINTDSYDVSMRDGSPTEPNDSFVYQEHGHFLQPEDEGVVALEPLPQPTESAALEKQQLLSSLFFDPSQTDFSHHPALLRLSGEDLDIPIDITAHTALHWAATLARIPLLRALIGRGASIFRINGGGETALIRACLVTNNLDHGSFPDLLELLGPTIELRDGRGRTVLHHIAVSSAVKGRSAASKYYLESLLEFIVRQGSAPSSQQNSFMLNNGPSVPATARSIGLARFMSEIVNAQDKSGDTALNLAARIGNRSIIQQLLEVGADAGIPNRGGLKPIDFNVGGVADVGDCQVITQGSIVDQERNAISKVVGETSRDIMSSMSSLLSQTEQDFTAEVRAKQDLIDETLNQLRERSSSLGEERRRLEDLERKAAARAEMKQKVQNLRRAADDQRYRLSQNGMTNGDTTHPMVLIGEADTGLEIKAEDLPEAILMGETSQPPLNQKQFNYLSSLPPPNVLHARLTAYTKNNRVLRDYASQLRSRSSELEEKYRKVVSMCTGVEVDKVDQHIGGLVQAVESEGGEVVDLGRIKDFLRRVEGVEA